jgi:Ca-activated chloride channel homolog
MLLLRQQRVFSFVTCLCFALIFGCNQGQSTKTVDSASPQSSSIAFNTEEYRSFEENKFFSAMEQPQSTFSIDVDTASYSNVRRILREGKLPPLGAVRIEELVNYFDYEYPEPTGAHPFSVSTEVATCPWNPNNQLMKIGLKGKSLDRGERKSVNLVFLLDVSGSMRDPNKLPLVQASMRLLLRQLQPNDSIAIAVYAGSSGTVLAPTSVSRSDEILAAIDSLEASGGTAGSAGIHLAYELAAKQFDKSRVNRVILCTDGDFNLGTTDESSLVQLIQQKTASGVELTVLGFGTGNWKDAKMELLAQHGNGNFAYIDSVLEAHRVLVDQLGATLETIAKDVKIQVDFNPRWVARYRLVGYENRVMQNQDFRNDQKDAGEIGAGHTVTAFYEIEPQTAALEDSVKDPNSPSFVQTQLKSTAINSQTAAIVRLRYKPVGSNDATELAMEVGYQSTVPTSDFQFAAAVAGFGMLLRNSEYAKQLNWASVIETAEVTRGRDSRGMRAEFIQLARLASSLQPAKL